MKAGIVLFAHGSRDPQWARPFEALAATLSRKFDGPVKLAYLELMQPSLEAAVDALAAAGVAAIRIVPVFLGPGGHVKEDLPKLVARARERHPKIMLHLEAPIGEQHAIIEAIATAIAARGT